LKLLKERLKKIFYVKFYIYFCARCDFFIQKV